MKWILLSLCSFSFLSFGQLHVFNAKFEEYRFSVDSTYELRYESFSDESYDFTSEGEGPLRSKLTGLLYDIANTRRTPMYESHILMQLSEAAITAWRGTQYEDRQRWRRLEKYFDRTRHTTITSFNLIQTASFRIDLMDHQGEAYYYDRKGPEGSLNLYQGKRPQTKEEKEETPVPVPFMTEEQLEEQMIKYLKRRRLYRPLKRGIYSYVGVQVRVDERSLYKSKIPTARVVIFLGAKRLKDVKIRDPK